MKVSSNDTTLAHALAKHEVEKAAERLKNGLGIRILESKSVKEFAKRVDALFHGRVIDGSVGRIVGSRAAAGVIVADGDGDGNLMLIQLVFNARHPYPYRVSVHVIPVIIQRHALARLIQRVTGESSLSKVVSAVQPHLHCALHWALKNHPMEPRTEAAVCGRGLELAGSVDEHGVFRIKTTIDADTMQSPMRKAWAMGEDVTARVTFEPLTKKAGPATI